jgi:hypothetical protein
VIVRMGGIVLLIKISSVDKLNDVVRIFCEMKCPIKCQRKVEIDNMSATCDKKAASPRAN